MGGVLENEVAIVTGASTGVGTGEALELAEEGAEVAVLARGSEGVVAVANEIEVLGGEALAIECDVRVVEPVDAAVAAVVERSRCRGSRSRSRSRPSRPDPTSRTRQS